MAPSRSPRIAVVGGGPAGLMAAEASRAAGMEVALFEHMGSVGRKFLLAGKGGLNLTHGEPFEQFVQRYGPQREVIETWLAAFDADTLRAWARTLGVETFVGSSGRVFPVDLKAAPLLRAWVRRLRSQDVRFHVQHRIIGWTRPSGKTLALRFETPRGPVDVEAEAAILALGGGSWPQLGSDGRWVECLSGQGIGVAPLQAANCGFDVAWSEHLRTRHAGLPVKPVLMRWTDRSGDEHRRQGEFILTAQGIEGSLVYAASRDLREAIEMHGSAQLHLDLLPGRDAGSLATRLAQPRKGRSIGEHLRRSVGLDGARVALLFEIATPTELADPARLAARIKSLPLRLLRPRPLAEAISSAGGVRFSSVDEHLMLKRIPGLFCAGEMLDWEAPTGGYLLSASLASGVHAARGAVRWLHGA
ncbi:MAG: TIGR03862 family flavoprotein [Panacagrimonas sp.]